LNRTALFAAAARMRWEWKSESFRLVLVINHEELVHA